MIRCQITQGVEISQDKTCHNLLLWFILVSWSCYHTAAYYPSIYTIDTSCGELCVHCAALDLLNKVLKQSTYLVIWFRFISSHTVCYVYIMVFILIINFRFLKKIRYAHHIFHWEWLDREQNVKINIACVVGLSSPNWVVYTRYILLYSNMGVVDIYWKTIVVLDRKGHVFENPVRLKNALKKSHFNYIRF